MTDSPSPPPGFTDAFARVAFARVNGPLFMREGEGPVQVGFRVEQRHADAAGHCHYGMLAFAADLLLIVTGRQAYPELGFVNTISLSGDCLAPARVGDWVEGEGQVLHRDGRTYIAQGVFKVGGVPVYRTSGVFRG